MVEGHGLSSARVLSQVSPTGTTAPANTLPGDHHLGVTLPPSLCVTRVLQVIPTMILLAVPHGSLLPGLHVRRLVARRRRSRLQHGALRRRELG